MLPTLVIKLVIGATDYSYFTDGNWQVPHSLALFEETDVLCVADREGGRVECINAGLQRPLHANRDDTGKRVVVYDQSIIGRPYAIASKGEHYLPGKIVNSLKKKKTHLIKKRNRYIFRDINFLSTQQQGITRNLL